MVPHGMTRAINLLIESMPRKERNGFRERCLPVKLLLGNTLYTANRTLQQIYFPLTGIISLVAHVSGHPPLEMGLIGSEGMLGSSLVLGVNRAPLRAIVQGSGTALRMSAIQFRQELHDSPALLQLLGRYHYELTAQVSINAACSHFHHVTQRLARLLLMTHDRAHADHFYLTHQSLASMLGVRRSGVTIAAGILQKDNLIHYTRGEICILDRARLEAYSCECYAAEHNDRKRPTSP